MAAGVRFLIYLRWPDPSAARNRDRRDPRAADSGTESHSMIRSSLCLVAAVACLATAPLGAQQPQQPEQPAKASVPAGPRLAPEFKSFKPKLAQEEAAVTAAAAAADRTVI